MPFKSIFYKRKKKESQLLLQNGHKSALSTIQYIHRSASSTTILLSSAIYHDITRPAHPQSTRKHLHIAKSLQQPAQQSQPPPTNNSIKIKQLKALNQLTRLVLYEETDFSPLTDHLDTKRPKHLNIKFSPTITIQQDHKLISKQ